MDRAEFFKNLKGRASILTASTAARLSKFIDQCEANATPENMAKLSALRRRALDDRAAMQELNRARSITVDNFVVAQSNASSFFNRVNLDADEAPILENITGQEMKARLIGEDGKPHLTQILKNLARTVVPLSWLSTRQFEYPLVDLYRGDVSQSLIEAAPLARDLAIAQDQALWPLIKALPKAVWVQTGPAATRTFVLHSAIDPANIPPGNFLDMTSEGAFDFNIIKAIVKWFMQMGNTFGEAIIPKVIYVPSIDVGGFIDQITLNTFPNVISNQIFEDGYVLSFGGKTMAIVGDSTLPVAAHTCYVRSNLPIGDFFRKPSMDEVLPSDPSQIPLIWRTENKGRIMMRQPFGAVTPLPWSVRMLAVKYK